MRSFPFYQAENLGVDLHIYSGRLVGLWPHTITQRRHMFLSHGNDTNMTQLRDLTGP